MQWLKIAATGAAMFVTVVPSAFASAAMMECKFHFRHTCYVANCESVTMPVLIVRFDPQKASIEECGGFNRNESICDQVQVTWTKQEPNLAVGVPYDKNGIGQPPLVFSWDPMLDPSEAWLIRPALGGIGILSGRCEHRDADK